MAASDGHKVNLSSVKIAQMHKRFREWRRTQAGCNDPPVEQSSWCQIPGCPCEGCIEYMEWGPEDMTETDDSDYEDSSVFDRPVTESVTAWAGSDTDYPSGEHFNFFKQPVTESVTAREADTEEPLVINVSTVTIAGSDKDISSDEDSTEFDRPVTESATAWAGSDTDRPSGEQLKMFSRPVTESVTAREEDSVADKCVNSDYSRK